MQSIDLPVTIVNASDCVNLDVQNIDLLKANHATLARVSWVSRSYPVLISSKMKEQLKLNVWNYLPPQTLHPNFDGLVSSRGPFPVCDAVYLLDSLTGKIADYTQPILVPDLPVDFVLGTAYFERFDRGFKSGRVIILSEERERQEEERRRQTYKDLLWHCDRCIL